MILKAIKSELKKQGISEYRLARLIGVNPSYIYKMLHGGLDFGISKAEKAFKVLGLQVSSRSRKR